MRRFGEVTEHVDNYHAEVETCLFVSGHKRFCSFSKRNKSFSVIKNDRAYYHITFSDNYQKYQRRQKI